MAISQKAFFGKKGGITFSGGEPTLQAEALIPLFKELKANGIHICLDSNGGIWNEKVEELFSLTDLVLLDIKQFNPERHRTLTGRSNEQTLRTAAWLEEHEHPFWLRYVLVPGYSDSEEDTRLLGGKSWQIPADTTGGNTSLSPSGCSQIRSHGMGLQIERSEGKYSGTTGTGRKTVQRVFHECDNQLKQKSKAVRI